MSSLPLLPGYTFMDPLALQKPIKQSLGWKKGVPLVDPAPLPILSEADSQDLARQERSLQFGVRRRSRTPPRFLPEWAVLEKKVLRFSGYFTEHVEGTGQVCRIRPVVVYYYLLDDALMVTEPRTPNSGLDQGRQLGRQRVPHPEGGFWHWTHLNLGMDLCLYGRHYIICDCDAFTKDFLLSEGTELGKPLPIPVDPYDVLRKSRAESPSRWSDLRPHSAPLAPSGLRGLALKFDVMVEESEGGRPAASPAVLLYRPEDQTVELRRPSHLDHTEIKKFSPVILRAVKVPKYDTRKAGFVDIGEEEQMEVWLTPRDLAPPTTVTIFGRRVMVTGCDDLTRRFLLEYYGVENAPGMKQVEATKADERGSSGRTQSDIVPRPLVRRGIRDPRDATVLRFAAQLDTPDNKEGDRNFIMIYHVADATIEIKELARPGGLGGRVLSRSHVPKPQPEGDERGAGRYAAEDVYTLNDFYIGSILDVWGRRYVLTGADRYVLSYVRQHAEEISPKVLSSLATFFGEDEKHEPQIAAEENQ
ncbi:EF-hand domain-containing protein 1-like [Penaeus vannamei]|uniref:EF-hand domain-containing protein 1-like n=1 Tax=Penaeus vannamei TaxID=6689 RepID=UPI00387F41C9